MTFRIVSRFLRIPRTVTYHPFSIPRNLKLSFFHLLPVVNNTFTTSVNMAHQVAAFAASVPMSMFAENRKRLSDALMASGECPDGAWILLQGDTDAARHSQDVDGSLFRQESYMFWTFGVEVPDFYGAMEASTGRAVLFMPRLPAEYAVWMGRILPPDYFKQKYEVDSVYFVDEISAIFKQLNPSVLLLLSGKNTDSGKMTQKADFKGIENLKTNDEILHPIISECRVFKSDKELEVLRYAAKISVDAHIFIMKSLKPEMYEFQLESLFKHYSLYNGGCRSLAYTAICASGCNGAILHYGHAGEPNSRKMNPGELMVLDLGAEYFCYCSDITQTLPVSGKFSEDQKLIYNAVLDANLSVQKNMKAGVSWIEMHELAEKVILQHLIDGGILKGSVDEMMAVRLGAVFMPHGLGHFLGLDTHDVGGYPKGTERLKEPGLKCLRTTRILQPRMVITTEPGCYFIDHLLDEALADPARSKFINADRLQKFRGFGGVRIEDDVVVLENGVENLSAGLPRKIEEIEKIINGN